MTWDSARKALDVGTMLVDGVEKIEAITHLGGAKAEAVLAAVRAALVAVREGLSGATDPGVVLAQIDALHAALAGNDAAADKALDDRFDTGGP